MNRYGAGLLAATLAIGLGFTSSTSGQQPQEPPPDQGADYSQDRGVARISVINGDVSVRRGDSGEVVAAALNAPLVAEDRLVTGDGSRAEIQFDSSNMIRVSPQAEIRLAELANRRYQIQIARGTVTFRVLRDETAEVELSTPSVSVRPVRQGSYRVTVHEDGTSEITVRSGEADIYTPRGSERLGAGRTMLARGTAADPEVQVIGAVRDDDWDHWNDRRDRDLQGSRSYQYVSQDIYGAEDLDANGRWVPDSEYGNVWVPYTSAGWAPYRNGRWVWIDYYGWSWVSYDSWGWAPYHYGRWFYRPAFGWGWYPGGLHERHYWSPALVAFFGFGGGGGGGFGHVGWVPLAPHEPYYRWYGSHYYSGYRNGGYGGGINIVNNVNITNVYDNARVSNGITGVDQNGFGRGRVGGHFGVSPQDLNRASLVRGQLPVAPGRESLRMSDRQVSNVRLGSDNERFASRFQAAQVNRVPFEQQRRSMEQVSGRSFGDSPQRGIGQGVVNTGRESMRGGNSPAVRNADPTRTSDGGWRRFGEPVRNNSGGSSIRSETSRSETSNTWRGFGEGNRGAEVTGRPDNRSRLVSEPPASHQQSGNPGYSQRYQQQAAPANPNRMQSNGGGYSRGESIRISPPIVKERAPERGSGGGGGGSRQAAPSHSGGSGGGSNGGGRSRGDGGGHNGGGGGRGR